LEGGKKKIEDYLREQLEQPIGLCHEREKGGTTLIFLAPMRGGEKGEIAEKASSLIRA